MSAGTEPVRSRRSRSARPTIAVTGAASGVGRGLAARLMENADVRGVVAIDERRGDLVDVTWRVLDVRDPVIASRLRNVHTLVHLAADHSLDSEPAARTSLTVRGTQTVLTAAAAAGVKRVVLCTSATVYGALPDNPVPLDEDGPLRAEPDGAVVGDLLEVERLAEASRRTHPGLAVTVVRPATLVGPGADSSVTRHFEAPRLLVVRGGRPAWQFCHVEDLLGVLELAALGRVEGVVTAGCEGFLEQEEVERLSGMRRIELPPGLAFGTAERLHRLGVTPAPASELSYVTHPWVVPSTRAREAGWRPMHDNTSALLELLAEVRGQHTIAAHRLGRRDATLGAAGATVAVLGTAALVRRARRRRQGAS